LLRWYIDGPAESEERPVGLGAHILQHAHEVDHGAVLAALGERLEQRIEGVVVVDIGFHHVDAGEQGQVMCPRRFGIARGHDHAAIGQAGCGKGFGDEMRQQL
jgi:hypothetical protein